MKYAHGLSKLLKYLDHAKRYLNSRRKKKDRKLPQNVLAGNFLLWPKLNSPLRKEIVSFNLGVLCL